MGKRFLGHAGEKGPWKHVLTYLIYSSYSTYATLSGRFMRLRIIRVIYDPYDFYIFVQLRELLPSTVDQIIRNPNFFASAVILTVIKD